MTASARPQGLLDTNILFLRRWINPNQLPDEMAISAVTLAELSAGPHQVRPDFNGLTNLLNIVPISRPHVPHERR